jgi:endonuclease/exonuclease/phosphatase (EEP) superfamily protein YafD
MIVEWNETRQIQNNKQSNTVCFVGLFSWSLNSFKTFIIWFDIIHTVVLMQYISFIVSIKTQQLLYDLFIK